MPTDKDSAAVSSRTCAGQQPPAIALEPQLEAIFSKVILQTIDVDAQASPTSPLVEALINGGFTTWFHFIFSCDDDQFSQLTGVFRTQVQRFWQNFTLVTAAVMN